MLPPKMGDGVSGFNSGGVNPTGASASVSVAAITGAATFCGFWNPGAAEWSLWPRKDEDFHGEKLTADGELLTEFAVAAATVGGGAAAATMAAEAEADCNAIAICPTGECVLLFSAGYE